MDVTLILLDPALDLYDGNEETEVRSERIVVFLRFERWRYAVFRDDVEMYMSGIKVLSSEPQGQGGGLPISLTSLRGSHGTQRRSSTQNPRF